LCMAKVTHRTQHATPGGGMRDRWRGAGLGRRAGGCSGDQRPAGREWDCWVGLSRTTWRFARAFMRYDAIVRHDDAVVMCGRRRCRPAAAL